MTLLMLSHPLWAQQLVTLWLEIHQLNTKLEWTIYTKAILIEAKFV